MRSFDLESDIKFFHKIMSLFSNSTDFQVKNTLTKNTPIFICGMPRSGTTFANKSSPLIPKLMARENYNISLRHQELIE